MAQRLKSSMDDAQCSWALRVILYVILLDAWEEEGHGELCPDVHPTMHSRMAPARGTAVQHFMGGHAMVRAMELQVHVRRGGMACPPCNPENPETPLKTT